MPAQLLTIVLLIAALLSAAAGCTSFADRGNKVSAGPAPPTPEQQQWWAANRDKARYMPGRGFYVEGTSGYFDDQGRRLPSDPTSSTGLVVEDEDTELKEKIKPKSLKKGLRKLVGKGPNEQVARAAYDEAEALFRQAKYKDAAAKYAVAYDRWPDSPLEEKALFMAAECYFFADLYPDSDDNYALLIKKYPATEYLDKTISRRFAIARYWEQAHAAHPHYAITLNLLRKTEPRFDTYGHALRIYERIRLDDPTGPLADDAIMATANAHFVHGRYDDADYHYSLLRSEYPKSEHQFQAHLLGLRAKLLKYQGPNYEGGPLEDSEQLATQLLAQFPTELGDEKERIVQAQAEIRAQRALREFERGEYYHKGKYYGASKLYYAGIVEKYPETRLADEARTRMEAVKGEPDVPERPFDWIVNSLPESKKLGASIASNPNRVQR